MQSKNRQKQYSIFMSLLFLFNLVMQVAIPVTAYAEENEVPEVEETVVEEVETVTEEEPVEEPVTEEVEEEAAETVEVEEEAAETEEVAEELEFVTFESDEMALANAEAFELALMHMNDTHARVEGYAQLVTEVNGFRNENPASLLLHAGDVFTGTLYFNQF